MAVSAVNKQFSACNPGAPLDALSVRVARGVEEVPRGEWDSVFPDALDGYLFFKSIDESGFTQFSFYYILVYDGLRLAGIAPCFVMDYPLETSVTGGLRRFVCYVRKYIPSFLSVKAVFCGVPMGQGKIGISGDRQKVMALILSALDGIAKENKAPIVAFKDFTADYAHMLDGLAADGFIKIESLPSAEMEIDFASFDDYMARLSRKTRQDLRRKFKKADGAIRLEMEVTAALSDGELGQVYKLYLGQIEKHEDTGFEIVPREFFSNISRNMPDKARFFLWRKDGKIVAFVFALASRDYLSAYYLGLDYSLAYQYHLYFVRFRDIMKWCIENGIKKCDVGVTGYEPKKRLDFGFVPLYVYAKYRNRLLAPAFRAICSMLKFENFDRALKEIRKKGKA